MFTKSDAKKAVKKFSKNAQSNFNDVSKNLTKRLSKIKLPAKLTR